jgi:hypothetical protein
MMNDSANTRESKFDLQKLFEAATRAEKEIATWSKWRQDLVKWVHDEGWKQQ